MSRLVLIIGIGAGLLLAAAPAQKSDLVDMEVMTHSEIYAAIHEHGKTTALVYNGGTEQRGPQCVLGGHTLMGKKTVEAIARKLGNALATPILPFAPTDVNEKLPGAVSLSPELFAKVNEAVIDSMVRNGFKNIIVMGDHDGGQKELKEVAQRMDAKYGPQGTHVYFCSDVYAKANNDFDEYLKLRHLPPGGHGSIPDTSEMMYLGGDAWVRKDKITVGDPVLTPGQQPDPNTKRIDNGITGDARPSSIDLGRRLFEMKVAYAVAEITRLVSGKPASQ